MTAGIAETVVDSRTITVGAATRQVTVGDATRTVRVWTGTLRTDSARTYFLTTTRDAEGLDSRTTTTLVLSDESPIDRVPVAESSPLTWGMRRPSASTVVFRSGGSGFSRSRLLGCADFSTGEGDSLRHDDFP